MSLVADDKGSGPTGAARVESLYRQIGEVLTAELGTSILRHEISGADMWARVSSEAWKQLAEICKKRLEFDYFCFLSGIDWMANPDLSGEKVFDPDAPVEMNPETGLVTGVAGGDTRFQVFARLYSIKRKAGITLRADLDDQSPRVETWTSVYKGADWHERETWEMYGFVFEGHPGLRHLYLPGEFEGFPLRKDFPLLAREVKPWPGLVDVEAMPGEEPADNEGATTEGGAPANDTGDAQ